MTTSSRSPVPHGFPAEQEDDHDLLTYGIADDRLREEIASEERALGIAIEQHGENSQQAADLRTRLDLLRSTLRRHEDARANELNEKQFFGEQVDPGPQRR